MKSILNNLFLLFLVCLLATCSLQISPKELYFFDPEYESEIDFVCIPIQYNKSTYILCSGKDFLYDLLNIKICSKEEFDKFCYQSIIQNIPILVDSMVFNQIVQSNSYYDPNEPIPQEWNIYKDTKVTCDTLHTLFLRQALEDKRINYLIYNCWEQDIFVGISDELGPYYLNIYDSKNKMRIY